MLGIGAGRVSSCERGVRAVVLQLFAQKLSSASTLILATRLVLPHHLDGGGEGGGVLSLCMVVVA